MNLITSICAGILGLIALVLGGFSLYILWDDRRTTPAEERGSNYWEAS